MNCTRFIFCCFRELIKKSFLILLVLLFVSITSGQYECNQANTPQLNYISQLFLVEDQLFTYDLNLTKDMGEVTFSFVPINITIEDFSLDKETGIIKALPKKTDKGVHSIFVIATTPHGCYDIEPVNLLVYAKPQVNSHTPTDNFLTINETQPIEFIVNATAGLETKQLFYQWFYDSLNVKNNTHYYLYSPNYTSAGAHTIKAVIIDSRKVNTSVEWKLTVKNKNRKPYLKSQLPSLLVGNESGGKLLNLNNYIADPDGDELKFSAVFVDPYDYNIILNQSYVYDVLIDFQGELAILKKSHLYLTEYVRINATDTSGAYILTDPFSLKLASKNDSVEFLQKQSVKEKCEVKIICRDFSECLPSGIRVRECFDINNCNDNNMTNLESEACDYNATCFDKLQNQGETGIDCGDPCGSCPTCSDNIQNQGEAGIDCGGPCKDCPNCYDTILNLDETDIDCGGSCQRCEAGKICKIHFDCASLACHENICSEPSCQDSRKNQGEAGIDCGGPCTPCATCNDKIKNQNEEDIDCGGSCKPCVTCSDKIKNQGELFTDCGGPCKKCTAQEFLVNLKTYIIIIMPVFFLLVLVLIMKAMYNKDKIGFLIKLTGLINFLPKKLPDNAINIFIDTINKLQHVKQELFNLEDKKKVAEDYQETMDDFFRKLFQIEGSFSSRLLAHEVKSKLYNPFLREMYLELYSYAQNVSSEAPLFKIELNEKIDEVIALMGTLRELTC